MRKCAFLLLVIISNLSFAQSVEWGAVNKGKYRSIPDAILKDDAGSFYILTYFPKKDFYIVDKYRTDLSFVKTLVLQPKKMIPKKAKVLGLEIINNEIYLFFQLFDKKSKKVSLFKQIINKSDLTTVLNSQQLMSKIASPKNSISEFWYKRENDHLLFTGSQYSRKEGNNTVTTICYDANLNKKWQLIGKSKFRFSKTQELTTYISKSGDCYKIISARPVKSANYKTYIQKINVTGAISKELRVDKYASSAKIIEDQNKLKIIGTYSLDEISESRGLFSINSNYSLGEMEIVTSEFSSDFIAEYELTFAAKRIARKERKAVKKNNETRLPTIDGLQVKSITVNNDKTVNVVAEVSRDYWDVQTINNADGSIKRIRKHYFVKGVICVFKLNESGKLMWLFKIPKHQKEEDRYLNAGITIVKNDNVMYILYNGNKDNYTEDSKFIKSMSNTFVDGCLVKVTINLDDAEFNREILTRYNKTKQFVMPANQLKQNSNEIIFPGGSGKKQSLVKVKL